MCVVRPLSCLEIAKQELRRKAQESAAAVRIVAVLQYQRTMMRFCNLPAKDESDS
jgi:hypothetical protein